MAAAAAGGVRGRGEEAGQGGAGPARATGDRARAGKAVL